MSAFVQPKSHIDALLRVAMDGPADRGPRYPGDGWHRPSWTHAGEYRQLGPNVEDVGAMLIAENVRSVQYRYPDDGIDSLPGPIDNGYITDALLGQYAYPAYGTGQVRISAGPRRLTAVEALKALDGYEYQACEHPGWADSEARAFCEALRGSLIRALPGYDEADTWEVNAA